jgi:hypothetical protein
MKFSSQYDPKLVEKWGKMIDAWDSDISSPCPYEDPKSGLLCLYPIYHCTKFSNPDKTTTQLHKELAKEELEETSSSTR